MGADGLHFFCDTELPVAAVAIGAQCDVTTMFDQFLDRGHFILDVQIGIDANAPDEC